MMKLALMRTATEEENQELPLLQRISSLELPASEIAAQINTSQSSSNTHLNINCMNQEEETAWSNYCKDTLLKDTNKKRFALDQKHEQWTLDWWKSPLV